MVPQRSQPSTLNHPVDPLILSHPSGICAISAICGWVDRSDLVFLMLLWSLGSWSAWSFPPGTHPIQEATDYQFRPTPHYSLLGLPPRQTSHLTGCAITRHPASALPPSALRLRFSPSAIQSFSLSRVRVSARAFPSPPTPNPRYCISPVTLQPVTSPGSDQAKPSFVTTLTPACLSSGA